jgi:hypothetical protein
MIHARSVASEAGPTGPDRSRTGTRVRFRLARASRGADGVSGTLYGRSLGIDVSALPRSPVVVLVMLSVFILASSADKAVPRWLTLIVPAARSAPPSAPGRPPPFKPAYAPVPDRIRHRPPRKVAVVAVGKSMKLCTLIVTVPRAPTRTFTPSMTPPTIVNVSVYVPESFDPADG